MPSRAVLPVPRYRLLAVDVDGTLAVRGDEVTPATRGALARAREAGVEVAIATGRRWRRTRSLIEGLGLPLPAVCLGGSLVMERDGRALAVRGFERADLAALVGLIREHGHAAVGHAPPGTPREIDFRVDAQVAWNPHVAAYVRHNEAHVEADRDLHEREDVLLVGTFGDHAPLRALQAAVEAAFRGVLSTSLVPSTIAEGHYLEVVPGPVSKWSGLQLLGAALGIPDAAICAVGDEMNDLPMLRGAGLGVAMGNACPEAREAADWVTGRHDEDGLVAVVDRILAEG